MKLLTTLLFLSLSATAFAESGQAQGKLLDKIVAVVNTRVISLSELKRMEETLPARKEVSPLLYNLAKYAEKDLLELIIRSFIIRDKINAQGYVINDDAVESRLAAMVGKLPNQNTLIVNVWGGVVAIIATVLAVLAFGADRFDGGVGASALVRDSQAIQATTDKEQDTKLQLMDDKLDLILKQTAAK